MSGEKLLCEECGWKGRMGEELTAPNPFCPAGEEISGCPDCFAPSHIVYACTHEDCWEVVSCGTAVDGIYVMTCGRHMPADQVGGDANG